MNDDEVKLIIEALLMTSGKPLRVEHIAEAFQPEEKIDKARIKIALERLKQDYATRAIELQEIASGFCLQTKIKYTQWINRLQTEKPSNYSNALLETLAIIAYRQPVTRADIEEIRGVTVGSNLIKTLLERDWVKIAGFRDVPGKPALYITTKAFLDYFNLQSIQDLPPLLT